MGMEIFRKDFVRVYAKVWRFWAEVAGMIMFSGGLVCKRFCGYLELILFICTSN